MNDRQIRAFLAVSRQGSFSRAAEGLYLSKQGVIKQVDALEKELGFRLLLRGPSGVTLTPAGQEFAQHAARLTARMERAVEKCRRIAEHQHVLRISSPPHPRLILERAIDAFARQYPDIRQQVLLRGNGSGQLDALLAGDADVAECTVRPDYSRPGIGMVTLARQPYRCLVAASHPLAGERAVTLEQLRACRIAVNRLDSCQDLLEALQTLGPLPAIEERRGDEVPFIFNFCLSQGVYVTKAYFAASLTPMVALPLTPRIASQIGLYYLEPPAPTVEAFLNVVRTLYPLGAGDAPD
ncbi:MAG: LysR family transcriptional regulator [Candidatus Spyradocola sp.]